MPLRSLVRDRLRDWKNQASLKELEQRSEGRKGLHSDLVTPSREAERRLWLALAIASIITTVEFFGGIVSQSLALVSDSGHILTDVFTIGLSILTIRLARRPHTSKRTFGYHRAEIFASLLNGSSLIIIAVLIIYGAVRRFLEPSAVQGTLVITIASLALIGNLIMTRLFVGTWKASLNIKGVFLHAIGDILSSSGVIVGGLVVIFFGYTRIDPVIAVLIGFLILRNAFGLVRESTDVLMEATPRHLGLEAITKTILGINGVKGVHDLHVWTITSGLYALSGHVTVGAEKIEEGSKIIEEVSKRLRDSFGIEHVTLQLERESLESIQGPRRL